MYCKNLPLCLRDLRKARVIFRNLKSYNEIEYCAKKSSDTLKDVEFIENNKELSDKQKDNYRQNYIHKLLMITKDGLEKGLEEPCR